MVKDGKSKREVLLENRKASHTYHILETVEAGMELWGTEVKSLRIGKGNLSDSFARIEKGEVWLYQFDIAAYTHGNRENHEPKRRRKLLLHRGEIRKLFGTVSVAGRTLVPLKGYFKRGYFKLLLGVGQGKTMGDKRETLKKRDADREVRRAMANVKRGKN